MGAAQSTRKITLVNDDKAGVIKLSESLAHRLRGQLEEQQYRQQQRIQEPPAAVIAEPEPLPTPTLSSVDLPPPPPPVLETAKIPSLIPEAPPAEAQTPAASVAPDIPSEPLTPVTPEPVQVQEPISIPEVPTVTSEPTIAAPETPVVAPEPAAEPIQPVVIPEPTVVAPEPPAVVPEPPTVTQEPVVSEPIVAAEPIVATEPIVVAEPLIPVDPVVVAEPILEPEPLVVPEPVAVVEPVVVTEPIVPEPVAVVEPIVVAEPIVPEPVVEEPITVTEPVKVEPVTIAESILVEPIVVLEPVAEPITVAEPVVVEPITVAEPVAESLPEPTPVITGEPEPTLSEIPEQVAVTPEVTSLDVAAVAADVAAAVSTPLPVEKPSVDVAEAVQETVVPVDITPDAVVAQSDISTAVQAGAGPTLAAPGGPIPPWSIYAEEAHLMVMRLRAEKDQEIKKLSDEWRAKLDNREQEYVETAKLTQENFTSSLKEVESMFVKATCDPVCQTQQEEVMKCYQDHPHQSLRCAREVSQFAQCVDLSRLQSVMKQN